MYSWQFYLIDSFLSIPCNLIVNITRDWRLIRWLFNKTAVIFKNHPGIQFEKFVIDNVDAEWILPIDATKGIIIYYVHGGGFCLGSINSHRSYLSHLSHITNIKILAINYCLAPQFPFPAGYNDCLQIYNWLVQHYPNQKIIVMGESAGGGLCLSILLQIINKNLPKPVASILLSPWLDLTLSGDSLQYNQDVDNLLKINNVRRAIRLYCRDHDPADPMISPLLGNLKGLPPLLVLASQSEILLSDSLRLKNFAEKQGVKVQLDLWPDMPHAWPFFAAVLPEARLAIIKIKKFIEST